ncbi:hypothetical protein RND71_029841 [Anisodus tanguticus]|uniref:Uncharacterized protein n=1 Tax=Anisodus tanguticus TaxID=243964 RepID=A0AAE1UZ37_9SOLA|nr:hypothetical protein RND71_029841 [Anisodus tanguticus]
MSLGLLLYGLNCRKPQRSQRIFTTVLHSQQLLSRQRTNTKVKDFIIEKLPLDVVVTHRGKQSMNTHMLHFALPKSREVEPNYSQQKLQISLNNSFGHNEVDQAASILNPITVSTGLRLSYEEKERNSSVTSAPENMKAALPALLPIDSGFKYETNRQREEFDHYMKVQKPTRDSMRDLEIDNLNRKNRDLGERIKQITIKAQLWHYRAKYNESVVNALKSNIQQAMAHGSMQVKEGCGDSEVNDAASSTNHHLARGSQDPVPQLQQLKCRACKSKEASVMKTASVQVYMS